MSEVSTPRADSAKYQSLFADYKARVEPFHGEDLGIRLEHHFECLSDWSIFHSLDEVKDWFDAIRADSRMEVEDIALKDCRDWLVDEETGDLSHASGEFFRVHGVRVTTHFREAPGGWDQPILTQVGYDGGLLGILRKRFRGIPHYLIEAKCEPGNYKVVQLSPTLQATFSNLKRAHSGRKPAFSSFFETPEQEGCTVLYDQWLSEDGGRLHKKRNRGMLVEAPEDRDIEIPPRFIWLSMYQIKSLLNEDAWVNPHIRGIIAHL